jgi:hypothetical protein
MKLAAVFSAFAWLLASTFALAAWQGEAPSVGMPARLVDLVLPGTELEAANQSAKAPLALRVLAARPHGDAFRYEFEYWGLEPGEHDLRGYLRRKDGSTTDDLPPIPVSVRSVLPAGLVKPHPPDEREAPSFGGYRALLLGGGVVWTIGLAALLVAGHRRRRGLVAAAPKPRTLAERLEPLVQRAMRGELSREERSQLELGLLAYWRRKLALEQRKPAEALHELRGHAEAGPLLRSLEDWLHKPGPEREVDVRALLEPYERLPEDALETALAGKR